MQEVLTLRSSIQPQLRRKTLFKGFLLALIGISIILISGVFFTEETLDKWGIPIFVVGVGLITWGLLPYRNLSRIENKPDELMLVGTNLVDFYIQGQKVLSLPTKAVKKWMHIETDELYGIGVQLHPGSLPSVTVYQSLDESVTKPAIQKQFQVDLFFPYFTKRSFDELLEELHVPEAQQI